VTQDTIFEVRRSKVKVTRPLYSPPCWRVVRQLQWWAWERVGRDKLLLCCRLLGRASHFGALEEREGLGHIVVAARLQLVLCGEEATITLLLCLKSNFTEQSRMYKVSSYYTEKPN